MKNNNHTTQPTQSTEDSEKKNWFHAEEGMIAYKLVGEAHSELVHWYKVENVPEWESDVYIPKHTAASICLVTIDYKHRSPDVFDHITVWRVDSPVLPRADQLCGCYLCLSLARIISGKPILETMPSPEAIEIYKRLEQARDQAQTVEREFVRALNPTA